MYARRMMKSFHRTGINARGTELRIVAEQLNEQSTPNS
jgi:hypothetical protein